MPEEKQSPPQETKIRDVRRDGSVSKMLDSRMDNKVGELPFQMELDPKTALVFKSDKLVNENVVIQLKITNPTSKRFAYKIKCTSNAIFRVRMPYGFVEPNSSHAVKITFSSNQIPKPGIHFFIVQHITAKPSDPQAKWLFATNPKPDGVARIACQFQKLDGTQWKETDKK
ncbi:Major sperm protein [Aphelenchoides besseyi]|nr:Major sperm protein [Aphelenchoides besseyi]KAI6193123.1 Major sperm protein [Aphelenchoides besseyi]